MEAMVVSIYLVKHQRPWFEDLNMHRPSIQRLCLHIIFFSPDIFLQSVIFPSGSIRMHHLVPRSSPYMELLSVRIAFIGQGIRYCYFSASRVDWRHMQIFIPKEHSYLWSLQRWNWGTRLGKALMPLPEIVAETSIEPTRQQSALLPERKIAAIKENDRNELSTYNTNHCYPALNKNTYTALLRIERQPPCSNGDEEPSLLWLLT